MRRAFVLMARDAASFDCVHARRIARSVRRVARPLYLSFTPTWTREGENRQINNVEWVEVTYRDLANAFSSYPRKFQERSTWRIMPGNLDLVHLLLAQRQIDIDEFWFCEDDVRYTGNMGKLVRKLGACESDLLCTNLRPMPVDWDNAHSVAIPEAWPLAARGRPTKVGFLPFFRASRRFFDCLDLAYKEGLSGHHEATFTAVAEHFGLDARDVNDVGSRRLYTSDPDAMYMAPGTFVYRPARAFAGLRRGALYHPVKGFGVVMGQRRRLWRRRLSEVAQRQNEGLLSSLSWRLARII